MAPHKFVIKCGNFAVLVDLHVLPLGGQGDASWFTMDHIEEVTALVQDAVDQRVKQFTEFLHHRRHLRQRNDLPPASACFMRGKTFNLIANFLKRHFNLRCVVKQHYGDLRVFPERYVVCVSCPEDATAHHGNPSAAAVSAVYAPPFPLPFDWQNVLNGFECYYRGLQPNTSPPVLVLMVFHGLDWS
ncbi:protein SLX4IP isoform X2 [Cynoglossus semilaevis]|nr:protein SLX4IP isoform X2 [Cynoglossus semilaevis]